MRRRYVLAPEAAPDLVQDLALYQEQRQHSDGGPLTKRETVARAIGAKT
jgi:hypothetical protein